MANESTYKIILDDKQAKKALEGLVKDAKAFEDSLAGIAKASIDAARGTIRMTVALKQAAKEALVMRAASSGLHKVTKNYDKITTAALKAAAATRKVHQETGQIAPKAARAGSASSNIRGYGQAAVMAVQQLKEMTAELFNLGKAGSQLQQLAASYELLGGSADQLDDLREKTKNMVPDSALKSMSNMGTLSGLTKESISKLASVSTGAAQALGRDFDESFNRIIQGTAKKEREFFDELGITLRSMVVVYKEFADGAGKKVSELTEKEKSLAFTNEVLRASSKQMEVGNLMAADSFAVAEATMGNYADQAKMLIADTLRASGAIEAFMNMGDGADLDITKSVESLKNILNSAAIIAVGIFEAILAVIEPLLDPLATALASIEGFTPILKIVASIVGTLVGWILKLMYAALVPLAKIMSFTMGAAADLAESLGQDGLAKTLRDSAAGFEKMANRGQFGTQVLDENAAAADNAEGAAIALGNAEAQLALDSDAVTAAFREQTSAAKKLRLALIAKGNIKAFTITGGADDPNAWMDDLGDERLTAIHGMTKEVAAAGGKFSDMPLLGEAMGRSFMEAAGGDEAKAMVLYIDSFDALTTKAQSVIDEGAVKLGSKMSEASAQRVVVEAEMALETIEMLRTDIEKAFNVSATEADEKEKKSGGKARKQAKKRQKAAEDEAKAHAAAILAGQKKIMSAREFADMESEKNYQKVIADLEKFGENALVARVKIQRAFEGFGRSLGDEFIAMAESMEPMIEGLNKTADAFSNIASNDDLESLGTEFGRLASEQERTAEASGSLAELAQAQKYRETADAITAMNDDLESQRRAFEALDGVANSTGSALESLFGGLAEGAKGTDEIIRGVFGQLFTDLAATMIAWASAEIAALTSPFLGLVASIAFKGVAAAIGGVIKRKPSSGGGSGQANASRKAGEGRNDRRRDRDQPGVTVFNYGFSAPDEITQGVSSAERRAQRLRGK